MNRIILNVNTATLDVSALGTWHTDVLGFHINYNYKRKFDMSVHYKTAP